ncbi:MAG: AmmeMemoRadiSam system protein B [Bacteroidales bacterium]|nr:AmmeMemoRadiSam system protein B [Bacteroidales bacterium]
MIIILSLFTGNCKSQDPVNPPVNRKAYAAGKFYTGNATGLRNDLAELFDKAVDKHYDNVRAIIVPHAGYPFSGIVAASGYNQINADEDYEHIFVIASSHTAYFKGASIYYKGNYETPLGEVEVDRKLAQELIDNHSIFHYEEKAHLTEHSLEVQLPFLQYHLNKPFTIIPVVLGTHDETACADIAVALKPYFNHKNLFVISTDFSHYPEYNDALEVDKKTANAVVRNSKEKFLQVLKENEASGIPNLATAMCGWTSVLSLLNITEGQEDVEFHQIQYMNSGDSEYSPDKSRVVGYYAIAVTGAAPQSQKDQDAGQFHLTAKDKADLLGIARLTMEEYVKTGKIPELKTGGFSETLKTPCGAFVTLMKNDELRGCIGRFDAEDPLFSVVQQMTVAAATRDYRFSKVKKEEFGDIDLEISVLTPMRKIESVEEIELGIHGIYIKKGSNSGTFLPQVATETGWTLEEFLGHCARDKARIGWEGWKDADVYIYEAYVFHE